MFNMSLLLLDHLKFNEWFEIKSKHNFDLLFLLNWENNFSSNIFFAKFNDT